MMQSELATTMRDDRPPGLDQRIVTPVRTRRLFRAFGVATALLVATGGYVHLCLYQHGYRTIPKIGVGFLLQVVTSAIVVVALLVDPHAVARVAHVTDGLAGTLTRLAAAGLAIGTLSAFALPPTSGGVLTFSAQ